MFSLLVTNSVRDRWSSTLLVWQPSDPTRKPEDVLSNGLHGRHWGLFKVCARLMNCIMFGDLVWRHPVNGNRCTSLPANLREDPHCFKWMAFCLHRRVWSSHCDAEHTSLQKQQLKYKFWIKEKPNQFSAHRAHCLSPSTFRTSNLSVDGSTLKLWGELPQRTSRENFLS